MHHAKFVSLVHDITRIKHCISRDGNQIEQVWLFWKIKLSVVTGYLGLGDKSLKVIHSIYYTWEYCITYILKNSYNPSAL